MVAWQWSRNKGHVALVPEALVLKGDEGGEEEVLVESVENLTSMLESHFNAWIGSEFEPRLWLGN